MTSTKDTKGQDEATLRFLRKSFSDYYAGAKLEMPDRFGRREWGFMFFGRDSMLRHLALRSADEARAFLRREAPAHSYHSTAYYERPDAQNMKEKKWLGADLIFDLDADHIEGSAAMGYEEMLSVVKREIVRLAEEFILGDLGFDIRSVQLVFSGGRGYHIHVRHPSVLELGSRERREMVDYITGVGLDLSAGTVSPAMQEGGRASGIFRAEVVGARGTGRFAKAVKARRLPAPDAPGWEGRMARATLALLAELEAAGEKAAVERMTVLQGPGKRGLGAGNARKLYADLFAGKPGGLRGADRIRQDGVVDVFSKDELAGWFFEMIKETAGVKLEKKEGAADGRVTGVKATGETDEPVTSDVKRLIRLPTSLHGKTGFLVAPLSIDEVKGFEPLRDAVVLPAAPVRVAVRKALQVRLRGEDFRLEPGPAELPAFAAVFAMGRGAASFAG
ncbi:MAG: DNA primase catalytic subunit PriS [Euryarchaeota archaeon]|nr:DNA primase catalytic subunit PriS [Euryarchaeota archaeon]